MKKCEIMVIIHREFMLGERMSTKDIMNRFNIGRLSVSRYIKDINLALTEGFVQSEIIYNRDLRKFEYFEVS